MAKISRLKWQYGHIFVNRLGNKSSKFRHIGYFRKDVFIAFQSLSDR